MPTRRACCDHLCPTPSQLTTHAVTTCCDPVSSSPYPCHRNMMHNQKYLQSAPDNHHSQPRFCSPCSGKKGSTTKPAANTPSVTPRSGQLGDCTGPDAHLEMGWVTMPGYTCNYLSLMLSRNSTGVSAYPIVIYQVPLSLLLRSENWFHCIM